MTNLSDLSGRQTCPTRERKGMNGTPTKSKNGVSMVKVKLVQNFRKIQMADYREYWLTEIQLAMGLAQIREEIKEHWDILRCDWCRKHAHKQIICQYLMPDVKIPEMVIEELRLLDRRLQRFGYPPEYRRYYQQESNESICQQIKRIRFFWITIEGVQRDFWDRQYLHIQLRRRFTDKKIPIPPETVEEMKLTDEKLRSLECPTEFTKHYREI